MAIIGESNFIKAPVRAVKYLNGSLIWGEGNCIHMNGKEIKIPNSERIISLYPDSKESCLYIASEFSLFYYSKDIEMIHVQIVGRSRILSVLDEDEKVWIVLANGTVQLFHRLDDRFVFQKSFASKDISSVFYSAAISRLNEFTLEIAFGTIFSGILVTKIDQNGQDIISIFDNLIGHNGSIFDIKYHPEDFNILVSCSDDRSIRIWRRGSDNFFKIKAQCFDLNSRVWAIDVQGERIAAISEDNCCSIFNLDGILLSTFQSDSFSKSIWSVSLSRNCDFVALGSNDSSVVIHNLTKQSEKLLEDYLVPDKTCGFVTNIITTPDGTCYASTDCGNVLKIRQDSFSVLGSIEMINKKNVPSLAVTTSYLYVTDGSNGIYAQNLKSATFGFTKLGSIETVSSKVTIKFVEKDNFILLESLNKQFFIFYLADYSVKQIVFDRGYTISCVYFENNVLYIGCRQGYLLVFDFATLSLINSILIFENESIKSIKSVEENDQISVLNRLCFEVIIDKETLSIVESKRLFGKGVVEGSLGSQCFSTIYNQQFIVNNPEIGIIDTIFCGGGHRLWYCSSDDQKYCLGFMKNGKLTLYQGYLDKIELKASRSHGKEIRCAHVIKDELIISGSEDGLLILRDDTRNFKDQLRLSNTSIKCLTSCDDLIFSGGSNESIDVMRISIQNNQKISHLTTCPKQIFDLETRVLCLDSKRVSDDLVLILAGYSDASIRIFEFDVTKMEFKLKFSIGNVHQKRCVQQIKFISSIYNNSFKFISAGTDGILQAWIYKNKTIEPLWNYCLHLSGIDSLDICMKLDGCIQILTGGEDGHVALINVFDDGKRIELIFNRQVHNSSVTGVKIYDVKPCETGKDHRFISASIDRFISVQNIYGEVQLKRTLISDISAVTLTENCFTDYGSGIESFKLNE